MNKSFAMGRMASTTDQGVPKGPKRAKRVGRIWRIVETVAHLIISAEILWHLAHFFWEFLTELDLLNTVSTYIL